MIEKHEINALMKAVGSVVKDHVAKAIAENNTKAEAAAKTSAAREDATRQKLEDERLAAEERNELDRAEELADLFVKGLTDETSERWQAQRAELSAASATLQDVDSQIRASVGIVSALAASVNDNAKRVDSTLDAVVAAARHTEQSQARVAKSMEQLALVLASPTEPVYDERGILKGARRIVPIKDDA
jgi:hypothetical protein